MGASSPDFFMAETVEKPIKPVTFEYPSATATVWVTIRPSKDNEASDYKVAFYKSRENSARYKTSIPLEIEQLQLHPYVVEL